MTSLSQIAVSLLVMFQPAGETSKPADLGFRVAEGFTVSLYADDALAHDIYSMTIDAQGRVVVAGREYVKILHDDDRDGRADRATLFSATPKSGAHGMCFDGPDLICTGDNALRRIRDENGDGAADGEGDVWAQLRHPEHGANGIVRGPDGWFYVSCGNDAGVSAQHAKLAGSPVREPKCGAVVRVSPDGRQMDVYAHGFRNPYDLDFAPAGQILMVDADGERDHHLPWYAPMRLFDLAQGMEHGWLIAGWQRSWNRPQSYFDNVERLVEMGRGSPTGAVVYRHRQFPQHYRGGLFTACWTMGRVYYIPLERRGATYSGRLETFLATTGDIGFAPVDLAVGPEGDLFVAIGGRGTRGGVFRVRHATGPALPVGGETLDQVLAADQPLSSWSRAKWVGPARQLGRGPFEAAVTDAKRDMWQQIRAVEVLTELFGGLNAEGARGGVALGRPELSARIAWSLSRSAGWSTVASGGQKLLAELTHDADPAVRRAAWEGLAVLPAEQSNTGSRDPNWRGAVNDDQRRVRAAAILAARGPLRNSFDSLSRGAGDKASPREVMARLWVAGPPHSDDRAAISGYIAGCLVAFEHAKLDIDRLEAVRLLQIGLGDLRVQPGQAEVYSGYVGNATEKVDGSLRAEIVARLAGKFPTNDAELNRELGRLLCMLAADAAGLPAGVAAQWTAETSPEDDIHFLIVMSRLSAPRTPEVTNATAKVLAGLPGKMAALGQLPSRNWPLRMAEVFHELCGHDPLLAAAVVDCESFGRADHSLFVAEMQGEPRLRGARRLLARALSGGEAAAWNSQLVEAAAALPDEEIFPVLRAQWQDFALKDAITDILCRSPQAVDRERFVEALASLEPRAAARAGALESLPEPATPAELAQALRGLKRLCLAPAEIEARRRFQSLLEHWSGQSIDAKDPGKGDVLAAYQPWFTWFAESHPTEAAALRGPSSADAAAWRERLAKVDWPQGSAERGKLVFEKRTCNRCHMGGSQLGPSLAGAARRVSRDDLFVAIVEPSREVAPLYQTTLVTTKSGQAFHGLLVYDSPEGTLLETGSGTTVRITGEELESVQPSGQSLMPEGLLNDAADSELADLDAYLRTLLTD